MKKWEEAEKDASKAIEMDPKNAKVKQKLLQNLDPKNAKVRTYHKSKDAKMNCGNVTKLWEIFLFKALLTHSSFLGDF